MTEANELRSDLAVARGLHSRLLWDARFLNGDLALGRINQEARWVSDKIREMEKRLKEGKND